MKLSRRAVGRLPVVVAKVLGALIIACLGWVSPVYAQGPDVEEAWYWKAMTAGSPLPSGTSGVPEGSAAVGYYGGAAEARTSLRLPTSETTSVTLTLEVDSNRSRIPELATILACPSGADWSEGEAMPWAAQPVFDCTRSVEATYDAEASTLTIDLTPLLHLTHDARLSIILTPAEDTVHSGNLVPQPGDPAPPWSVIFTRPTRDSLAVSRGPTQPEPPPSPPPLVGDKDGSEAPSPPSALPPSRGIPPTFVPEPLASDPLPPEVADAGPSTPETAPDSGLAQPDYAGSEQATSRRMPWPVSAVAGLLAFGLVFMGQGRHGAFSSLLEDSTTSDSEVAALDVRDLSVSFGGVRALDGVTFSVPRGQIVGLIGPNGAGKTTALDAITGLVPSTGDVCLGAASIVGAPLHWRAAAGVGRSFQDARLFPSLTVRETIAVAMELRTQRIGPLTAMVGLGAARSSEREIEARVDELIDLMGLTSYSDTFISELSTGSRRIVDLAAQVAHGGRLLLLDEPSSGIAQREAEQLGPVLRRLRDQLDCTIVVVEHDMPLITGLADRLIALETGRIIADGSPEEVVADPRVVQAYLGTDDAAIRRSDQRQEVAP